MIRMLSKAVVLQVGVLGKGRCPGKVEQSADNAPKKTENTCGGSSGCFDLPNCVTAVIVVSRWIF